MRATSAALQILAVVLLVPGPAAFVLAASGREQLLRGNEIDMTVDTRWAGGAFGGYYPIRIRLTNHGREARPLTVQFSTDAGQVSLPTVEKQVSVEANATVRFSLSVPLVGHASSGFLRIRENGVLLDQLTTIINLAEPYEGGPVRPAALFIGTSSTESLRKAEAFEHAATLIGSRSSGYRQRGGRVRDEDHVQIGPELLPDQWVDYTALDLVFVSLEALQKMRPASRAAILQWTESGGTLVVHSVDKPPGESADLARVLEMESRRATGTAWIPADPDANPPIAEFFGPNLNSASLVDENGVPAWDKEGFNENAWDASPQAFHKRPFLLGTVFAFSNDPLETGTIRDWAWWLNSLEQPQRDWPLRNGLSTRHGHSEFREFSIPGVGSVPVTAFLVMISLFTILIGPVNYFVLSARKQLYLLVLTVPVFAFITSGALLGYAVVADGFGVRSRLRSITLIDQRRNVAVSLARESLYAGLVPSGGLSFRPETAVYPVRSSVESRRETLDWTSTQHFSGGLMQARAYCQLATVSHRAERGRIDVRPGTDGQSLEVANGLAWSLDQLLVHDVQGRAWFGRNIAAGATARLALAEEGDLRALAGALSADRLVADLSMPDPDADTNPYTRYGYRYAPEDYGSTRSYSFRASLMEQHLSRLNRLLPTNRPAPAATEEALPRQSWLAVTKENPNIELGGETEPEQMLNVLVGWD